MVAILDFRSDCKFYLQVSCASNQVSRSTGLSVQEKKQKIDFQAGGNCGYLGFPIWTIIANFDLQVTLVLHTKFRVSWPFCSGEEANNRYSRWPQWRPLWISDKNEFSFFIYKSSRWFLPGFKSPFGSGEEEKNRFSRWPPRGHLGFRIGTILAIFDEQVTPMFPSKFQISWFFVQRKRKIDFKDGRHRGHLGFSARNDFSYFLSTSHPRCSAGFSVQEKKQNNKFRRRPPFPIGMILSIFWSTRHPDASYQVSSQLAQVCRRRRLLKQIVDATRRTRTTHDGRGTLTDHKSSPWSWKALQRVATMLHKEKTTPEPPPQSGL